jgi:hypothetical protein
MEHLQIIPAAAAVRFLQLARNLYMESFESEIMLCARTQACSRGYTMVHGVYL